MCSFLTYWNSQCLVHNFYCYLTLTELFSQSDFSTYHQSLDFPDPRFWVSIYPSVLWLMIAEGFIVDIICYFTIIVTIVFCLFALCACLSSPIGSRGSNLRELILSFHRGSRD